MTVMGSPFAREPVPEIAAALRHAVHAFVQVAIVHSEVARLRRGWSDALRVGGAHSFLSAGMG